MVKSKKSIGRPSGRGDNIEILSKLKVGESFELPADTTPAAVLQVARNRFYNPAKRLGIQLSFSIENNVVTIKREA